MSRSGVPPTITANARFEKPSYISIDPTIPTNSAIPRHGGYSTDDQRFLDWLDRMTNRPAITDASQAVSLAHDACRDLAQGVDADLVNKQVSKETGWSIDDAYQFISIAMTVYPNCGVIGGP